MRQASQTESAGTVLLVGASRGLGLAMAEELAKRRWRVIATQRGNARGLLHDLAQRHDGCIEIEALDINQPDQITALRHRLSNLSLDVLFVNAGTANMNDETVAEVPADEFARVLVTNALSPMRVIEAMQDLVKADGLIGAMSSGQGSISNNTNGRHEIYRCSKSALNQLMRSYAARQAASKRALLLMAPGWIRTDLGGANAPVGVEEAIPLVVDVLLAQQGNPGLRFVDRAGMIVPW